jgi:hypothetical protein
MVVHGFTRHSQQSTIDLAANVQDGIFEDDENRSQIGYYEVSCTLLLIGILA